MKLLIPILAALILLIASSPALPTSGQLTTYETWEFQTGGNVLTVSTVGDISGDRSDDIVVGTKEKNIYAVNAVDGRKIWNHSAQAPVRWLVSHTEATGDSRPDVLADAEDNSVFLVNGANGKSVWKIKTLYQPGNLCLANLHSIHLISDINNDGRDDAILVSSSGDGCSRYDSFNVTSINISTGGKIWEYAHAEDYHSLKQGTLGSSPVSVVSLNDDEFLDLAIVDDKGILYTLNGLNGSLIETYKLDATDTITDLEVIPDISGDGVEDAIGLGFIEGGGGPDYASIGAINLKEGARIWKVEIGDGFYDSGAVYSALGINDVTEDGRMDVVATQRVDNNVSVVVRDGSNGSEVWGLAIGADQSRNDFDKHYPLANIGDLDGDGFQEIIAGSNDGKLYLLNTDTGQTLWTYQVLGVANSLVPITLADNSLNILAGGTNLVSLSGSTEERTSLTIDVSKDSLDSSTPQVVSGTISPVLAGEIIELHYKAPDGSEQTHLVVIERDGTFRHSLMPEEIGKWSVYARFYGEGRYIGSRSAQLVFNVGETEATQVHTLKISGNSYPIKYRISGGEVSDIQADVGEASLKMMVSAQTDGTVTVELPRNIIDARDTIYIVNVNGRNSEFDESPSGENDSVRTLTIPFTKDTNEIEIIGTYVVPEFGSVVAAIVLAVAIACIIAGVKVATRAGSSESVARF